MKGHLTIHLDRERRLVYDFGAWEKIVDRYRKPDGEFDFQQVKPLPSEIPFLIWAGLVWEEPNLEIEYVKQWLNDGLREGRFTILGLSELVSEALYSYFGLPEEKKTSA